MYEDIAKDLKERFDYELERPLAKGNNKKCHQFNGR